MLIANRSENKLTSKSLQPLPYLIITRESAFIGFELRRMDDKPAIFNAGLVFDVKHLVVHHILDDVAGDFYRIENAADEDGMMRRVVAAKDTL